SCVWDLSARKIVHRLDGWSAAFTPDGKQIVVLANGSKFLRLYDTASGKHVHDLAHNTEQYLGFHVCQNGRNVQTGTSRAVHQLWDLHTRELVKSSPKDNLSPEFWDGKDKEVSKCIKLTGNFIDYILPGGREGMGRNLVDGRAVPVYELTTGRLVRKIA